ncbi:hypothetical protein [Pseudolabrys sp. Root1462]|uniref:hypothetical protein n=1 Tax=Pseudolabrys sp. Root1462 TaxID=1736466 RepID=UPI0012E3B5C8|nr:hypothetical protein [Pseudolabrys sp. Root1462]
MEEVALGGGAGAPRAIQYRIGCDKAVAGLSGTVAFSNSNDWLLASRRFTWGFSVSGPEPEAGRRRSLRMQNRKPRIVITCPDTGITVISRIAYEDMINPLRAPLQFKCPCGETHELKFVGPRSGPGGSHPGPFDAPTMRKETSLFK